MNIVAHLFGSLLRFVSLDEMLPEDISSMIVFMEQIKKKYSFRNAGESTAGSNNGVVSAAFQHGVFNFEGKEIPIMSLDFQGPRMQVLCTKTEHATAFIGSLTDFLVKDFGFRVIDRDVEDFVSSALVCDGGPEFFERVADINRIARLIAGSLKRDGIDADIRSESVRFSGNTAMKDGPVMGINYVLEERANRPPGTNWLFSNAPLSSASHVQMLEDMESIVTGKADPML